MIASTLSVALCTYNGARFLRQQLSSYISQQRRPDEIVVCDDRSTDDTLAILEAFADTAPFAVRIEQNPQKLGVAQNFARAISLCQGEIIALSDQDDVWFPDKLKTIHDAFSADPRIGMVFSDAIAIDENSRTLDYRLWDAVRFTKRERSTARRGQLMDVLLRHYVVTGATLAFRSAFRDLILPIPSYCLHDAWIGLLVTAVARTHIIDEPLIGYRQHPTQTSGGERVHSLLDQMKRARAITPDDYAETAQRFQELRNRFAESPYAINRRDLISALDQKIIHVRARERMHRTDGVDLPLICRELASGRYFRYSHAWKALLADLFL
jgi:glycosyltransferase involved in cell wall biosynthesis